MITATAPHKPQDVTPPGFPRFKSCHTCDWNNRGTLGQQECRACQDEESLLRPKPRHRQRG